MYERVLPCRYGTAVGYLAGERQVSNPPFHERSPVKGTTLKTRRNATAMLAALVTALTACASGASSDAFVDPDSLAIVPAALELAPGDSIQFTAAMAGAPVVDLVWHVEESGGGTVTPAGLYTAADTVGTYHVVATPVADASKATSAIITVKTSPAPPPPPVNAQGTGTSYGASHVTGVTGGGEMPSWTANVVTAACAGDGVTDDTACLQAAANTARDQRKVLVIPAKASFYRLTGTVTISTSLGGVGGMPTIKQTNGGTGWAQKMFVLAPGMSGWIYNLHLVGTFNGSNAVTEHGHLIDVGSVNGLTIKGNLLENASGDAVSTDISQFDGGGMSQNVLVDGNTMRNPYRCGVAFIWHARGWVITNNLIDKPVNFVSGVDIEPENGGTVQSVEVAYNKFVMNNRTENPDRGADGKAVFGWRPSATASPGGDFYIHHNYGTFGSGFSGFGNGGWTYIYQASNVEGSGIPN